MSWGENDDTTKHTFKCELLNLKLLKERDGCSFRGGINTWNETTLAILDSTSLSCGVQKLFGRIREEKITARQLQRAKYLDIKTIKKIEFLTHG